MPRYQQVRRPVSTTSQSNDRADGARLVNFYASEAVIPAEAVVPIILRKVPGFSDGYEKTGSSALRMLFTANSPVYGNHLFSVSNSQVVVYDSADGDDLTSADEYYSFSTETGFQTSATKPLRWATDGRYVMIITDDEVYAFDRLKIQENVATAGTHASVWIAITAPTGDDTSETTKTEAWVDVVWSDGYFILANQGGQIWNSGLAALSFEQTDFARADINPDEIVGLAIYQSKLYAIGKSSIELWWNAGATEFAFERDRQFSQAVGCLSRETIQVNEDGVFFVGNDLKVYMMKGGSLQDISNDAVHETLRIAVNDDEVNPTVVSFLYAEEGHKFYGLNIGDDGYYWVWDDRTSAWHERSTRDAYTYLDLDASTATANESDDGMEKYIISVANYLNRNWVITKGYKETYIRQMGLEFGKGINGNRMEQICQMPLIESGQTSIRHFDLQVVMEYEDDVNGMETADEDDANYRPRLNLSWNDRKLKDGSWVSRTGRPINHNSRIKFSRLGTAPGSGRNYRVTVFSNKPKMNMLGTYITVEELAEGYNG